MTELEKLAVDYLKARENHEQALNNHAAYHSKRPVFDKEKQTALENAVADTISAEVAAYIAFRDYVRAMELGE